MRILCLNLDSRPDRWEQVTKEFDRVGLAVERVAAISDDNRPLAFNQSVLKAMDCSLIRTDCGLIPQDLLLFEDDVVFDSIDQELYVETDCGRKGVLGGIIPEDFLTLHLGCNIIGVDTTVWQMPTAHSEHLAKLHNCWQSHATLYSAECVKFILDNLDGTKLDEDNNIFDDWLRRKVLSQGRSYVMKPMIAYQRPGFSDLWQTDSNYVGCHEAGNKILAQV